MLALVLCMEELVNAQSDSGIARRMWVHDTIFQRQAFEVAPQKVAGVVQSHTLSPNWEQLKKRCWQSEKKRYVDTQIQSNRKPM